VTVQGAEPQDRSEERELRQTLVAWAVVLVLVLVMLGRAGLGLALIGDRTQQYDYRTAPLIPASAYASSRPTPPGTTGAPKQVELPLPPLPPQEGGTP
jgi:hypothetical protein